MSPAIGNEGQRKSVNKCYYCERTFSRTEHLTRHERSHRNEKPFKCNHCDSTFARKDVIRRHLLRYHPAITEAFIGTSTVPKDRMITAASTTEQRQSPSQQQEPIPIQPLAFNAVPMDMEWYQDDFLTIPDVPPAPINPCNTIDAFLASMAVDPSQLISSSVVSLNEMPMGLCNLDLTATDSPLTGSSTSRLSTELQNRQSWRGSFEVSESKTDQMVRETQAVIAQGREPSKFTFPSSLAFERLLIGFSEAFLLYRPCIHLPTWQAETAPSCLLLAMASLSASFYKEHTIADVLYRAARVSIIQYLETSSSWTMEQPLWLIQTVLILMVYGTSSGKYDLFHEASSWASLLANVVRYKKIPAVHIADPEQNLLTAWMNWIDRETVVRTKCAVFCFLNDLNVFYSTSPALLNNEMEDTSLPSSESSWTSSTPESWLEARKSDSDVSIEFSEALDYLLSPSRREPVKFNTFGAYVMLHALMQLTSRLHQHIWISYATQSHKQTSYIALQRWQACWEDSYEFSLSPRNPYSAVSSSAAALFRLAYVRLHTDFSRVRSALLTHDMDQVIKSMKDLTIVVDRSDLTLTTTLHAVNALRTRVKMGMGLKAWATESVRGLQVHLVTIECCLFSCAWMREIIRRPPSEWTRGETDCVRLVKETLAEVELSRANAQKSYATQLVYAWALILDCCAAWGAQAFLADTLNRYADSLS